MIDYTKLLREYDLWPMSIWNSFPFYHKKPASKDDERQQIDALKRILPAHNSDHPNGLYAYMRDDRWIYVGKAKPLIGRIINHYRESFRPVPGDTRLQLWHKFFLAHNGDLTIYWKQVEGEIDRKILELALQARLKPHFDTYRKELIASNRNKQPLHI